MTRLIRPQPHALLASVTAGDVPSTPAIFERRRVIDSMTSFGKNRQTVGGDEQRSDKEPWHSVGLRGAVALEATVRLAFDDRRFSVRLIERVEDRAQLRIGHRQFNDLPSVTVTDVDVVVEVERARRPGRDTVTLHARL